MKIFKLCLFLLLVSPTLFNCQKGNTYSFVFNSNYCLLNNERHYQENKNTPIDLKLTIQEKYQATHNVPEDVYVLIGEKEGLMDEDYHYQVSEDKKSATISLCIIDDVTITANLGGDDELYKIGEANFNQAVTMTDPDIQYVQCSFEGGIVASSGIHSLDFYENQVSPTSSHCFRRKVESGAKYTPSEYYIEKTDTTATGYLKHYRDVDTDWKWKEKEEIDKDYDIIKPAQLSIENMLKAKDIGYDDIKEEGVYDSERRGYFLSKVEIATGKPYDYVLSFYKNRLTFFAYEYYDENTSQTIYGTVNFAYGTITPEFPGDSISSLSY